MIAVIGAGTMGNGIAHVFAQHHFLVHLIDTDNSALEKAISTIDTLDENSFNTVDVALLVSGKPLLTIPRSNMLWFFLFDIIHHRGQLSTYIRPMGGKNPAIYGYNFDSLQQ